MGNTQEFSRRDSIRSMTAASAVTLGGRSIPDTASAMPFGEPSGEPYDDSFPIFRGEGYRASDGVAGVLFSQVGYELGLPVRVLVRLPKKDLLKEKAVCALVPAGAGESHSADCMYWGEIWGSHWWVAEFLTISNPGAWSVEIRTNGKTVFRAKGLRVARNIPWESTLELSAVNMLERRTPFTKVGAGWQDAGTLWVESCSQSAMLIAMEDLLEEAPHLLEKSIRDRMYRQMEIGCRYLVMTQEKARELGFPSGAMSHDLLGHEKDILPHDATKAVIALIRASRLLPEEYHAEKETYRKTAALTWEWLLHTAKPMGRYGMSLFQRGLPENTVIPVDEWQTRDLVLLCWVAMEMYRGDDSTAKEHCVQFARSIMDRQIPQEQSENGYYGHFREFTSLKHSEKSWTHGIVNSEFGADIGGIYPNYLLPLIPMLREWPEHEDASRWKHTLEEFSRGFLIPACQKNPFYLVPQGIFGDEGPAWFCGTFHGTNTIYGFTAALALELAALLKEPVLERIAYGNLQWLVGLNAGITRGTLEASMVFSADLPEGAALPASMMCGVGNRWAGTWFQTRGIICNGFSTGKQFVYDTAPKRSNDGPFSLTDEDWIPHSAAWLTGLVRLMKLRSPSR